MGCKEAFLHTCGCGNDAGAKIQSSVVCTLEPKGFPPCEGQRDRGSALNRQAPEESAMNLMTSLMVVLAVIALMLIGFGLIPI
jgi:hypothetical protein